MRAALAALAAMLLLAACGAASAQPHHHHHAVAAPRSQPSSYPDVESLVAALAVGGAICTNVQFLNGSTADGATNPFVECSGSSNGDTAIIVFRSHADAVAYAHHMIGVNTSIGTPGAVVVGPDWAVNTSTSFARKVVSAVGGKTIN
jgi:hypothetical protein